MYIILKYIGRRTPMHVSVWNAILNFQTHIIRGKNKTKQNHKQTNK